MRLLGRARVARGGGGVGSDRRGGCAASGVVGTVSVGGMPGEAALVLMLTERRRWLRGKKW